MPSIRLARPPLLHRPLLPALALLLAAAPACSGPRGEAAQGSGDGGGARPDASPAVEVQADEVRFPAVVTAGAFQRSLLGFGMPGYHLVVWDEGKAAGAALFRSQVSDVAVLDALESLGAEPGDALGMATWEERHDPGSPDPDAVIQGPPVEVLVAVPERGGPLALEEILEDPGGRGFDMRFGGHRANIPAWHSGCVACLYSCPGSKVGNAAYTVRDYVEEATRFRVRPGVLPPDGTEVTLILRLPSPAGGETGPAAEGAGEDDGPATAGGQGP